MQQYGKDCFMRDVPHTLTTATSVRERWTVPGEARARYSTAPWAGLWSGRGPVREENFSELLKM